MKVLRVIAVAWALSVATVGVYQMGRIADAMSTPILGHVPTTEPSGLPVEWNEGIMNADTEALLQIAQAIGNLGYSIPIPSDEVGLQAIADAIRSLR